MTSIRPMLLLMSVALAITLSCKKSTDSSKTKTLEELVGLDDGSEKKCGGSNNYPLWPGVEQNIDKYINVVDKPNASLDDIKREFKNMMVRIPTKLQEKVINSGMVLKIKDTQSSNCKSPNGKRNYACKINKVIVVDSQGDVVRNINRSVVRIIGYTIAENVANNQQFKDILPIDMAELSSGFLEDLKKRNIDHCKVFANQLKDCRTSPQSMNSKGKRYSNLDVAPESKQHTIAQIIFAEAIDNWFCSDASVKSFAENFPKTYKAFKNAGCTMAGSQHSACAVSAAGAGAAKKATELVSFNLEGEEGFWSRNNPWAWSRYAGEYIGTSFPNTFGGQTPTRTLPPPQPTNYIPAIGGSAGPGAQPSMDQVNQLVNTKPGMINNQKVDIVTRKPEVVLNSGGLQGTATTKAQTDSLFSQSYFDPKLDTDANNSWESAIQAQKATMIGEMQSQDGQNVNVFYGESKNNKDPYVAAYGNYNDGSTWTNARESNPNAPEGTYVNSNGVTVKEDPSAGGFRYYDRNNNELQNNGCPWTHYLATDGWCYEQIAMAEARLEITVMVPVQEAIKAVVKWAVLLIL